MTQNWLKYKFKCSLSQTNINKSSTVKFFKCNISNQPQKNYFIKLLNNVSRKRKKFDFLRIKASRRRVVKSFQKAKLFRRHIHRFCKPGKIKYNKLKLSNKFKRKILFMKVFKKKLILSNFR